MAAKTYVNDNGTWREIKKIYVNDNGTWREAKKVQVNDNGTWRDVFASSVFWQGTVNNIVRIGTQPYLFKGSSNTKTSGDAALTGDGFYWYGDLNADTQWLTFTGALAGDPSSVTVEFNGIVKTFTRWSAGNYINTSSFYPWQDWLGQTLPLIVRP